MQGNRDICSPAPLHLHSLRLLCELLLFKHGQFYELLFFKHGQFYDEGASPGGSGTQGQTALVSQMQRQLRRQGEQRDGGRQIWGPHKEPCGSRQPLGHMDLPGGDNGVPQGKSKLAEFFQIQTCKNSLCCLSAAPGAPLTAAISRCCFLRPCFLIWATSRGPCTRLRWVSTATLPGVLGCPPMPLFFSCSAPWPIPQSSVSLAAASHSW